MSEQWSNKAVKSLELEDTLYNALRQTLLFSFQRAGYGWEECHKLTDIAISPVHSVLNLAHEAYKIHLEAASTMLPTPIFLQGK